MNINDKQRVAILISQIRALDKTVENMLKDKNTNELGRYSSYKTMAQTYNDFVEQSKLLLRPDVPFYTFNIDKIPKHGDMTWPQEKNMLEQVGLYTKMLIAALEGSLDFANDEFDNLSLFLKSKLRSVMFEKPEKEKDVQNGIESLFLGKNWEKGNDYDRESGKFEFSGKEYIPDFVILKYDMCIEVKLVKEGRKSHIIEEICADITAYRKNYSRVLFVVYDIGEIQNEEEFISDISKQEGVKIIVVKH